jgi:endo-1,4-beta-D-glucanase Y
VNPSYFAPGFYRAFANFGASGVWATLANVTYTFLERVTHASTGMVPNWSTINGQGGTNCNKQDENQFGYDATRTPWRIATDYVWWETAQAKSWLDRLTNWTDVQEGGINYIVAGHELSGAPLVEFTNSAFVGAFALAAMAHSQLRAAGFGAGFAGKSDIEYYQATLRAVYMLLATGKFQKGC